MLLDDGFLKQLTLVSFLPYSWPLPNPLCPRFIFAVSSFNCDMFGHLPPPSARHSVRAPHHTPHQFQDHPVLSALPNFRAILNLFAHAPALAHHHGFIHAQLQSLQLPLLVSLVFTPSSGPWFALIVQFVFVEKINIQVEVLNFAHCVYQVTKLLHHL